VYCAFKSPDSATWVKLDQLLEATLANEVGRKASVSQGSALLRVAASVVAEIQPLAGSATDVHWFQERVVSPRAYIWVDLWGDWI
jgi:urease accessory protein UreF